MAYSELVKNFERVRAYMRDFYVYGFKSRGDFYYEGSGPWWLQPKKEQKREVTLLVTDRRNALERVMVHFAHFEKRAERLADGRYRLCIQYYENDETEMVIRILSFGPNVQVTAPTRFVRLIKDRLRAQKSCELR